MFRLQCKFVGLKGLTVCCALLFSVSANADYIEYEINDISNDDTDWGGFTAIDDGLIIWNSEDRLWYYDSNDTTPYEDYVELDRPISSTLSLSIKDWLSGQAARAPLARPGFPTRSITGTTTKTQQRSFN